MSNEENYELKKKIEYLNDELLKRDNVIEYLLSVIEIIKDDTNIKEQQLDYLLDHIKNNNYQEFSYKTSTKKLNENNDNNQKKNNQKGNNIINLCHKFTLQKIKLNKINENLLEIIISYLPIKDIITVSLSNKKLNKICNSNNIWSKIYYKSYSSLLLFKENDTCEIIKNINLNENMKIINNEISFYKKNYIQMKKLNLSWEKYRPIVTTISTNSCVTCLNLNEKLNELIYSAVDGSAGLFKLYSYRKLIDNNKELYMQHHKQIKICEKYSSYYGHCGPIWSIDRNEEYLFTGSYDKTIKIWNIKNGICLNTIRAHNSWVSSIKFDKQFNKLISSSWDTNIKLWNFNLFNHSLYNDITFYNEPGNYIYCVESDLINDRIISGNEKKSIDIYNINKINEKEFSLFGHLERINSLKKYNNLIFSGSEDKHGRIWDIRNCKCEILLSGHNKGITQIDYDEISNRIFTSSIDKTIKIYDIRKNSEIRTLVGHSDSVFAITFDHGKLISGAKDNSIRVWNFLN